jgi:ABC-type transport system involved in multi-copper enzyme maturation permease subunit
MYSILKYILLTAVRDKLYVGLFIILLAAFGISSALGDSSLVESSQATIVYIAASSRMIFAVGMILFVCFYVRRSFENREVEFILSKSISRHNFIFAYLIGFILVALLIILPLTLLLLLLKTNKIGLFYWSLSLTFESLIIITFSLLAALILRSAVSSVLASLGFYVLSRMMGFFVLSIKIPQDASDFASTTRVMHVILKALSVIFPRLDLYCNSEWLIYGVSTDLTSVYIILAQSLIYIPLMMFMAFYDFNRKQF